MIRVGAHGNAEDLAAEERVDVYRAVREHRDAVDASQPRVRRHPQIERESAGLTRWIRLENDSVAYTVPSAAIAMSLHTPPLLGNG